MDKLPREQRSWKMPRILAEGTKPELVVRIFGGINSATRAYMILSVINLVAAGAPLPLGERATGKSGD